MIYKRYHIKTSNSLFSLSSVENHYHFFSIYIVALLIRITCLVSGEDDMSDKMFLHLENRSASKGCCLRQHQIICDDHKGKGDADESFRKFKIQGY